jgi:protein-disulfide isomerase
VPGPLDPPPTPEDHTSGRPDAPYVLTMYADFECPFCQAAQSIIPRVRKRLGDDLLLVYRHFPIQERHPLALGAAHAAEAAAAQGAFWEMHDVLFDLRGELERPALVKAAKGLGLDVARFEADLDAAVHAAKIEADLASAVRSGVTGTPAFFAGDQLVEGAFDAGSLVDALRAAAPAG